jgi:hypothetical protein
MSIHYPTQRSSEKCDTRRNFYAIPNTASKVDRTERSTGYPPKYQVRAREAYTILSCALIA